MASLFRGRDGKTWHAAYFDHAGVRRYRTTRCTDKRTAERIAAHWENATALRREGCVDPRLDVLAAANRRPLSEHTDEYYGHMEHVGRAPRHVKETKRMLRGVFDGIAATRLSDITATTVERHFDAMRKRGLSARTVNLHRAVALAFLSWAVRENRLASNPLAGLPRLDEARDCRKVRRALTAEEMTKLIEVARPAGRAAWYLGAALAGLRRSEMMRLTWADVNLDAATLTIRLGKAHRIDVLPIHPQLLAELRAIRPGFALPSARVYAHEVTNATRRRDFKAAKIKLVDDAGRVADLHALRTTLGTQLARQGVAPQVAARLMRHSDYRVTMKHYTSLSLVDTAAALKGHPGVAAPAAEAVAATGTDGAPAGDGSSPVQHLVQQSAHGATRRGAEQRDAMPSDAHDASEPKSRTVAPLRAPAQRPATQRNGVSDGTRTSGLQSHSLSL